MGFLDAGAEHPDPVVAFRHGPASSSRTWETVLPQLGRHAHVLALDLLGHGASAKPLSGDFSLGAYASELRDLLLVVGLDRATVVGHSFGGGVATTPSATPTPQPRSPRSCGGPAPPPG